MVRAAKKPRVRTEVFILEAVAVAVAVCVEGAPGEVSGSKFRKAKVNSAKGRQTQLLATKRM